MSQDRRQSYPVRIAQEILLYHLIAHALEQAQDTIFASYLTARRSTGEDFHSQEGITGTQWQL